MAYAWDLETNCRETKKGSYPPTDSHDISELIANKAARQERSCIPPVIPQDVVAAAIGQSNATLASGGKMSLVDMVCILMKKFSERYGVTAEMLEGYIGCKKEAFSQQSVVRLKNVYNTLQDGSASVEQYLICPCPRQNLKSRRTSPRPPKRKNR